jgi:hypothetical protein
VHHAVFERRWPQRRHQRCRWRDRFGRRNVLRRVVGLGRDDHHGWQLGHGRCRDWRRHDGKVAWQLDWAKLMQKPAGNPDKDWCHGNAITVDIAKDVVYANCRWIGLIKTTYSDPTKLIWHLPASHHGTGMGNMTFSPSSSQYEDTHDPEIHADGTILFFDNGGYDDPFATPSGTTPTYHSRVVEYAVDESAKTATLVWEFPGSFTVDAWYRDSWYQLQWGDADRLANGNVLVAAGDRGPGTESRVFEVTKQDGKVVWEFRLGPDLSMYRADRITPPLVKAIGQ